MTSSVRVETPIRARCSGCQCVVPRGDQVVTCGYLKQVNPAVPAVRVRTVILCGRCAAAVAAAVARQVVAAVGEAATDPDLLGQVAGQIASTATRELVRGAQARPRRRRIPS